MTTAVADDNNAKLLKECHMKSKFYCAKFPEIPSLTSTDLIRQQEQEKQAHSQHTVEAPKTLLVDVRTQAERDVSIIPGALSLSEFHNLMKIENPTAQACPPPITVVTYCTIGYRSGLAARSLQAQYALHCVQNLDGIISYTHACSRSNSDIDKKGTTSSNDLNHAISLVHPRTRKPTNRVHVYGPSWNYIHSNFEAQFFNPWSLLWTTAQVGLVSLFYKIQSLIWFRARKR